MGRHRDERSIVVDRMEFEKRYKATIGVGRDGRISFTRLQSFFEDCRNSLLRTEASRQAGHLGETTLKKILNGSWIGPDTVKVFFQVTRIDLREVAERECHERRIAIIREHLDLMAGRIYAIADQTAAIDERIERILDDLRWAKRNLFELTENDQLLVGRLAAQASGCLTMFRTGRCSRELGEVIDIGNLFAASIERGNQQASFDTRAWLLCNWPVPGWEKWCHPQTLLDDNEVDAWKLQHLDAATLFERAEGAPTDHSKLKVIGYARTLIQAKQDYRKEATRILDEISGKLHREDHGGRGYILCVRSHLAAKHGLRIQAVDLIRKAKNEYIALGGQEHRFVAECELRLHQLGDKTNDVVASYRIIRAARAVNSSIVDLDHVKSIVASRLRK
jgi:hypothetical protein